MNKKYFPVALLLAALACILPAQNLTLVSPNGGETLTLGQTVQITWTAGGVSQKVKLQLIRGGGALVGLIAGNLNAASGSFAWTVGQTDAGMAPADVNYKIRVRTADGAMEDISNNTFTIAPSANPPTAAANTSPYRRFQPELQHKPLTVTAQIVSYAVITSFKVDGQDDLGGAKVECRRWQGVLCTASAFSQSQPVLFRFSLHLEDTSANLRHLVQMTGWIQQSSYTFNVSQYAVLDAVFGSNPPSEVPLSLFGAITVEAKNATQAESPQKKSIQIKMLL